MKKKNAIIIISACAGAVLLAVVLVLILLNSNKPTAVFFYSDYLTGKLVSENRQVPGLKESRESFEVRLVKEYLLGPVNYNLRMMMAEEAELHRVFMVTNRGKEAIVLSLKNFEKKIEGRNEECEGFIRGLVLTLKANTKVKRLYILSDGRSIDKKAGTWHLLYPLFIQNGVVKGG